MGMLRQLSSAGARLYFLLNENRCHRCTSVVAATRRTRSSVDVLVPVTGSISVSQMAELPSLCGPLGQFSEHCHVLGLHRMAAAALHD